MKTFDVQEFIDRQKLAPIHVVLVAVCSMFVFIDGFDIFLIGKIAPAIAAGFGESAARMTEVFFLQQVGLTAGAFLTSPLGDRYGRKSTLIFSSLAFGGLTFGCMFANSITELAVMRGLAGFFLAGGLPITLAILVEYLPKRWRYILVSVVLAGYSAGSSASAVVAAWFLDDYGWKSGFFIGGLLPIVCVPFLILFVPESLQFRASRNPHDKKIAEVLKRMEPGLELSGNESFVIQENGSRSARKNAMVDVFADGRRSSTFVIWICYILSMGNAGLLAAWLPTFFQEMGGIPVQQFAIPLVLAYFGGLFGTVTIGPLIQRFGPTRTVPFLYLGLSAVLALLPQISFTSSWFILVLAAWACFQGGGQTGLNMILANMYPARVRATGSGWGFGAGRFGGIIMPLFGGWALATGLSLETTLQIVAIPPLIVMSLIPVIFAVTPPAKTYASQPNA